MSIRATARVELTIEVQAPSDWGKDCKIDQVFEQAGREAVNRVRILLRDIGGFVVGEPRVVAVLAAQERP